MNIILLSGGSGKRLWPLSNDVRSKQFIKLFKNNDEYESMVQRVYRQITTVEANAKITIATSKSQASAIKNQLGEKASICVEPCRRDTFPAIALAAAYLHDELGVAENEAVVVCPVDPYLNPDGHEWMRAKWSDPVRKYWKVSEQMMVKYSDLAVCDSVNIEKYIHEQYDGKGIRGRNPKTTFIAYGAETRKSLLADDDKKLLSWYEQKGLKPKAYYLVVGRFVPENNYETMIREFMKSKTKKDFAIITNVNDKFLAELEEKLGYKKDPRIKFVGTVYNKERLMKIRENAYGYFHGHEVGGTNPSLLEALGSTDLNLLLDVGFNREVAEDSALYWSKKDGDLARLIEKADEMKSDEIANLGSKSTQRIEEAYSWPYICGKYEKVWSI